MICSRCLELLYISSTHDALPLSTTSTDSNFDQYLQRIVRLGGAVDDDNSNLLVAQLLYLDSIGKKDITMYVNSPGGSVTAGQLLIPSSPACEHTSPLVRP